MRQGLVCESMEDHHFKIDWNTQGRERMRMMCRWCLHKRMREE